MVFQRKKLAAAVGVSCNLHIRPPRRHKPINPRDRYLEHVNSDPHALRAIGKYNVSRLPDQRCDAKAIAMLPAA